MALAQESFDLVLMDVQMPDMDGLEATTAIRRWEQETSGHVPIIAMTAHTMQGDEERCRAAGMDGYVSKPMKPEDLYAAIDSVLYTQNRHPMATTPVKSACKTVITTSLRR